MSVFFGRIGVSLAQMLGCAVILVAGAVSTAEAQRPEVRITAQIDNQVRVTLRGSRPARARGTTDAGRMDGKTPIQSASIMLSRSAAQQSALDALIAAQQNPSSPLYHQWLSPDVFAAQYGAADADLAKVQGWLQSQGFTVDEVSRNRSVIRFSGTVAQIEAAFGAEMHYVVNSAGEKHFAPASDLTIPAAFSGTVLSVRNLTDFRKKPHMKAIAPDALKPNFTSSQTQNHFLTPLDIATIYDINPAYNAGYTGSGQSIAVIGQSAIVTSDITNFQNASGTPVRLPTQILIPNSGASTLYTGDESESDLDLEYSGAIAKNATIYFVYTGSNSNMSVDDALQYAVTNRTAPIISYSYGECEYDEGSFYASDNAVLQQAAAQGQTVVVASGDSGANDCYDTTTDTTTVRQTLYTEFPASSQYVTSMGGTEFTAAAVASGANQYWAAAPSTDVIGSALSYIPEIVWNDDSAADGIGAGGGGISIYTPRPSWQTGVPGIPAGSYRLVPDISLASSPNNPGYLYCTSDTQANNNIQGSCSNGFRNSSNTTLSIAGGTSFATPIFAGMLALINQKTGSTGQGVANTTLYALASNATTYATAFHDINTGNNGCVAGTMYYISTSISGPACTTAEAGQYAATTGYDLASGLGSVDLYNLLSAWPNQITLPASATTVAAATLTPKAGANDTVTFTVASAAAGTTTTPTGSILLTIDGAFVQSIPLVGGVGTYAYSSTVVGTHTISGVYTGDMTYAGSSASLTLTVQTSTLLTSMVTLSPATTTAVTGVADAITITVAGSTPAPTGTLQVSVDNGTASTLTLTPGTTTSTASYSFTATSTGSHSVKVTYLGDTNYQTSTGSLTITAASPGTFAVTAPAATITDGSSGTETITVTPNGGFSGAVALSLTTSATVVNTCYTVTNPTVTSAAAVTAAVTIYTNGANCSGANALVKSGTALAGSGRAPLPGRSNPVGLEVAGLLALGYAGRRSLKLRGLVMLAALGVVGFGLSGCGSGSTTGAGINTTAAKGNYTVMVTATDVATGTKTNSTTFTLTIQ